MKKIFLAAAAVAGVFACPAFAATITVAAGEGAQERLQEALIEAQPGDTVELAAGKFVLTDGLSLDVDNVTVKGAGPDATPAAVGRRRQCVSDKSYLRPCDEAQTATGAPCPAAPSM